MNKERKIGTADNFQQLIDAVKNFNEARGWRPLSSDVAKSIVIEAAELLEKFQWDETEKEHHGSLNSPKNKEELGEEVADVFWYLITFSDNEGINLLDVLKDKLNKNEKKYPEKEFKGKHNPEFYTSQKKKFREERNSKTENSWVITERPGFLGKDREKKEKEWNEKYGEGNWRLVWATADGQVLSYEDIMEEYINGYVEYFKQNPSEAKYLTENFSFAYDKDLITKKEAFDLYALYQKPGKANQFHHVALNIALENKLDMSFKGNEPIKVRMGKPSVPVEEWPLGWKWSPGNIPSTQPENIPDVIFDNSWWEKDSIEDFYQSCKALQVKKG